ncbi:MAG: tandem-95 repeat protein [Planctomycetes bacterium]|nr:tandem-95 repeat protein [Planctomycetota bacterium]
MSGHKRNKAGLAKRISSVFKGVPMQQNDSAQQPYGAPEQRRADHNEPEPQPQVPQTSKTQIKRTSHRNFLSTLFSKKKANAMAKLEERLKAESQARAKAEERLRAELQTKATAEQKVKAEAEKMLLTQHRRYSVLAERVEAQAKEAIAAVEAKAEEKVRSYAAALNQAEEKLAKAEEMAKTEALTRAKAAEEGLKAKIEERRRVEAQAKEAIAAAKAEAEEKIRSYAAALNQAEEKLAEAEEKTKSEALTRAKAEEGLLASAKAEAGKAKIEERPIRQAQGRPEQAKRVEGRQSIEAKPAETTKTFKRTRWHVSHSGLIKRIFALISALVIFSAIALFAVSALNDPPVAEPGSVTTQEETPVQITLMGSAPDGEQLTYSVITGPSHGSLSGTAPNITYAPALNYNGPDNFTFSVNDGKADSDQVMISIIVLAVNDAPIANPQSETTKVNKSVSAALTGSDVDGEPLMFIICTEPEHGILTFDSNFNTNGRLIYTPKPYFTGPDIFTFKLNDGEVDSAPATVSINVAPNLLPVAKPHSVTTMEDTSVTISLTGSDPDSDPLAYSTVTGPSHGSLNGTAPNLNYTPNANFYGSDSFTFKVNDGTADSALATVSITVSPVNDPPVANDDTATTQEDTPVATIDVPANDTDIDNDTLTVTAVSQGTNGSVTINPDSTLSYSPHANFYGSDTFTYTISDNKGLTDTAKVNVTVNMVNDAPRFTSAPVTTAAAGALYTYDVNAADPDVGDTLAYSLTTKPADMTINSATGLIQWKPTQVGDNKIVVKVADNNSTPALDTQSFTITVNPPPPKIAKLTVLDGYNQRNRKTLSADGKTNLVQSSDNERWETGFGSYVSFDFSDVSIPADAAIKSVVVRVEHFEEERFAQGKLKWSIGTGWPTKPMVWAAINAPVHEGQCHEAIDSWDVTGVVDTLEKINSLQLQVKNNDNIAHRKTLIDYIYVLVEWD